MAKFLLIIAIIILSLWVIGIFHFNWTKRKKNPPVLMRNYYPKKIDSKSYARNLTSSTMSFGDVQESRVVWRNTKGSNFYGDVFTNSEEERLYQDFIKAFANANKYNTRNDSSFYLIAYLLVVGLNEDTWIKERYDLKTDINKIRDFQNYYYSMIDIYFQESVIIIRHSINDLWKSDLTNEEKLQIHKKLMTEYCIKIMRPIVLNYIKKYMENYTVEEHYYNNLTNNKVIDIELSIFSKSELNKEE